MAKKLGPTKTLVKWVDLFTCFHCGKEGRSPPLRRCSQCEIAYYCSKTCQRGHWKQHKAACIAAVAARAEDARRERLARAVREKGKDKVEGGEDDALCVICLGPPVDPVMVRVFWVVWLTCSRDFCRGSKNLISRDTHISDRFPYFSMCTTPCSCRAATSTASRAWHSCVKSGSPRHAPSAASRCRPARTSCTTWDGAST